MQWQWFVILNITVLVAWMVIQLLPSALGMED
jgi:hypothetical protein